jgi:8-oxo-dGTP pyrophosphatase MutT (NUDIX family)
VLDCGGRVILRRMAFELSASVVLWRGDEILVMKRGMGGFAGGGWFIPGGHVEQGEPPHVAAAREVWEEAQIALPPESLKITGVMTYETGRGTAHTIIYNADCPEGAECVINDEHLVFRWMTPEAYIARFLDGELLRSRGVPEPAITLAAEVARAVREAVAARS